jgi:hypothetical protein
MDPTHDVTATAIFYVGHSSLTDVPSATRRYFHMRFSAVAAAAVDCLAVSYVHMLPDASQY